MVHFYFICTKLANHRSPLIHFQKAPAPFISLTISFIAISTNQFIIIELTWDQLQINSKSLNFLRSKTLLLTIIGSFVSSCGWNSNYC